MIYGLNFGGKNILTVDIAVKKRFADRLNVKKRRVPPQGGCYWILNGLTDSFDESRLMVHVGTSSSRKVYVTKARTVGGKQWYGVYTSYKS